MAAAAYIGERKRPKEMTLPMTLQGASGEIILPAVSGWGTHELGLGIGLDWTAHGVKGREREPKQLRFGSQLRSRD
jgi:hypothetical protein